MKGLHEGRTNCPHCGAEITMHGAGYAEVECPGCHQIVRVWIGEPDRRPPRAVRLPTKVITQLEYEALLRGEPVEKVMANMLWLGLCVIERARAGWDVVFEMEDAAAEDGYRREVAKDLI